MALLLDTTFLEPQDLLDNISLPGHSAHSGPRKGKHLENKLESEPAPHHAVQSCCDRHRRATEAVAELQTECQQLVSTTEAAETSAKLIRQTLLPYISVDECPKTISVSSSSSLHQHLQLIVAMKALQSVQGHLEADKYRSLAAEHARAHRSQLRQFIVHAIDAWTFQRNISDAASLQSQNAALKAAVSASPVARACAVLRLSSVLAGHLEGEDGALLACSQHIFDVRQGMLEAWAPSSSSESSAPELCQRLRFAREALKHEAALHAALMRNKAELESLHTPDLCSLDTALLQLPGESALVADGLLALGQVLLAPLANSISRASTVAELSEVMASVRDELTVISASCSGLEDEQAAAALTAACEASLLSATQERLLFAAERDIIDVLAAWQPTSDSDILYPNRFVAYRRHVALGAAAGGPTTASDVTHTWFPPMYHCLRALSSLYRALTRGAFATCAQQAVVHLLGAMGRAAVTISAQQGALHGQLFLISQLLILREQLAPFDVSLVQTEHHLQLPSASDALGALVRGLPGLLRWGEGNLLYDLLTGRMMPALVQVHSDGRKDLESSLKSACERFIALQSNALAAPLTALIPGATEPKWEEATSTVAQWRSVFDRDFPHLRGQLALYLGSAVTHRILLTPIADSVKQVLNKCRAAAASSQSPGAQEAASVLRGALAAVTSALEADDDLFDPHRAQYWEASQQDSTAAAQA